MKTSSTIRAFNFCFLLAFGLAFLPIASRAQTAITCGQTIANSTTLTSENDQYTYAGTAGQMLSVGFFWNSCTGGAADIYKPNGQLLTTVLADCNGGHAINITLPSTGTYTILVHADAYNVTASYELSIQSVIGGGCDFKTIACGQTLATNTTLGAQIDAYSYSGTTGQMLSVGFFWNSCTGGAADIYEPNGQLLTTVLADCNGGHAINITLPSTGTYTILVHADPYDATAGYGLSIQSLTGGGCSGMSIACSQTGSGNISLGSEIDSYLINGCSGELVQLSTSGFSGSQFDLYDPTGNLVFSIGPGTASNITFSVSGSYTLLVHSGSYASAGSYSVTLTCIIVCTHTTSTASLPFIGGTTSGGGTYLCCFPVTVCATPYGCYNFVSWTLNSSVVSTTACYTFTATNNATLTANFAPTAGVTNQICGVQVAGTNVAVSGQTVAGKTYQLQSRSSLLTGSWSNVSGVILSNSPGGLIVLTNFGGALPPQKFYRFDITP
jgi:List-Bact-rpt repeat protein